MSLTIEDILGLGQAAVHNVGRLKPNMKVRVSTDSRTTKPGDVFFAIRGEHFDGHRFLAGAFESGAAAAVVDERSNAATTTGMPLVVVKDTSRSLGELSHRHRGKFSIPIIAIAGSNGKTTTKDMIAAVLEKRFSVLRTEGNHNNHIGVPQTLFRLNEKHDIAVVELGTNHAGELKYLCDIVEPTHGLITNIGREHLEFFGDIKGVAREEGALFDAVRRSGTAIVNADDPWVARKAKSVKRKITYGFSKRPVYLRGTFAGVDERACGSFEAKVGGEKAFEVRLGVPGKHIVRNALAAVAAGITFKIPARGIQDALARFASSDKRMRIHRIGRVTIVDDTYNANPDSMAAALETVGIMKTRGKKIAVLADMLELGSLSAEEHQRIGSVVGSSVEYLLTYGPNARHLYDAANLKTKYHYDQKNVLSEYLAELVSPDDVVLVKGSRGMKMEDVVTFLIERLKRRGPVSVSLAG